MENENKREKLKEYYLQIKNCKNCDLYKTRTNFVFGSGSADADILFVGEAPGKNEDLQGKPFVGQAGKILDDLLHSIGFDRNEVFITNVLKSRPPENRDPNSVEINACKGYLSRQIEIIDPRIICTLGKYSTQLLLDTSAGISGLRGKVFMIENRVILPINHPAAVLYTPSRLEILKEDFKRIKMIFDSYGKTGNVFDIEQMEQKLNTGIITQPGTSSPDSLHLNYNNSQKSESIEQKNISTNNEDIKDEQLGLF
jgi:uracil-DNA glycosylase family 4